jgi:polyvinyl alcohol dehydrogenase (cytochrome)
VAFIPAASWEESRSLDSNYPCCTFRGSVSALRARDGAVVWTRYFVDPPKRTGATAVGTPTFGPSGAAVWSAPTVDAKRGLLYVTSGDNYSHPATATSDAVLALDLKTGQIMWSVQTTAADVFNSSCVSKSMNCPNESGPDYDFGASAVLVTTSSGKDVLVAGQKSGVVYALDPDAKGRILWQTRVGKGGTNGGVQWGMASDGRNIYAAVSDLTRLLSKGGAATPGNADLDPNQGGGLTALDLITGNKVWFMPGYACAPQRPRCSPAQSAAVTAIDGAVFSGSLDGHIRAYSTVDGKLLWDMDTEKSFPTVNGGPAKGGSLDGAGPVITGGMVLVNSGYPRFGGEPGNVLLAFGVDDSGP